MVFELSNEELTSEKLQFSSHNKTITSPICAFAMKWCSLLFLSQNAFRIFSLRCKLNEICHLSSEIWFSDDELLKEPAARFCHDQELAIMFITKPCKLKMRTLPTTVQIHRRNCLEKKLVISIFNKQLSFETNRLPKIKLEN